MASALASTPAAFVNADVALGEDAGPIVGSFTVDGLTYALAEGGVTLVTVAPSGPSAIPSTVAYDGIAYDVVAIGAYAFYLSGATEAALPATVASVDERAFRSSDVERVEVDAANPFYASFDGCLYGGQLTRLLLVPGGRQGAVRIAQSAEEVETPAFSHCAGVDAISADAGSASFASWDGLLYNAEGTTLLRVPAGIAHATIREGCTVVAAGAMEGCARLESIDAPASVTFVSPDVFSSVPTVSLPAAALADGAVGPTPQLTAMVALSSQDDLVSDVSPEGIAVSLPSNADAAVWRAAGFSLLNDGGSDPNASLQASATYGAASKHTLYLYFSGSLKVRENGTQRLLATYTSSPQKLTGVALCTPASVGSQTVSGVAGQGVIISCDQFSMGWLCNGNGLYWTTQITTGCGVSYASNKQHGIDHCCTIGVGVTPGSPVYCDDDYCSLSFDGNDGSVYDGSKWVDAFESAKLRKPTSVYVGDAITMPNAKREGWTHRGWATKDASGNLETDNLVEAGATIRPSKRVTYYAVWSCDYMISFDGNVVDDDAHPAMCPAEVGASRDVPLVLPTATRFGYIFKGWATHPSGTTANGHKVFAPGESVVNLADTPGEVVNLYALWALKYDASVPICSPADMTFALDATGSGDVKAVPADYDGDYSPADMEAMGSAHKAAIESRMAVPVAVSSVSASAIDGEGFAAVLSSTDGGAPERQLAFTISSGEAKASVHAGESADFEGLMVPEASESMPVASLDLSYGLSLEPTAVVIAADGQAPVPVAQVSCTLDIIEGMAAKWGFFVNDAGTPVPPSRIKEAANDIALHDNGNGTSSSDWYPTFKAYMDNPDAKPAYLRVEGATDKPHTLHQVHILGICQDTRHTPLTIDGKTVSKAGLTFGFREPFAYGNQIVGTQVPFKSYLNSTATNSGSWTYSALRQSLHGEFFQRIPVILRSQETGIVTVVKRQQQYPSGVQESYDAVFVPSGFEVTGSSAANMNPSEGGSGSFRYQYFAQGGSMQKHVNGSRVWWWTRSAGAYSNLVFCGIAPSGNTGATISGYSANASSAVVPCFAL